MSSQKSGKGKTWLKVLLIVIICVVAAGAALFIWSELRGRNSTDQLEDHLAAGQEYMAEGSYAKAANEFAAAIEINPSAISIYSLLADAYIEMGDQVSTYETYDFAMDKILSEYESGGVVLHGTQDICDKMISYYDASGDSEKANEVRSRMQGIIYGEDSGEAEEAGDTGEAEPEPTGADEAEPELEAAETEAEEEAEEEAAEAGEEEAETGETKAESDSYIWVVEPTIEADDINYVSMSDYSPDYYENDAYRQKYSRCAVIEKDGLYGLIDIDGEPVTEIIYDEISDVGNPGKDDFDLFYDNVFYLSGGDTDAVEVDGEWLFRDWYDETTDEWVLRSDSDAGSNMGYLFIYDGKLYGGMREASSNHPVPVKQADEIPSSTSDLDMEGNYAVFSNGKPATDYIYDLCGSYSSGLLAVSLDGKWGYINSEGEVVIPIEYDASWTMKDDYNFSHLEVKDGPFCYAATDGYVALVKDGVWELRDTGGNLVISPGEFEEIRPVYEEKCWVKQDGKWGVIQIGTAEDGGEELSAGPLVKIENVAVSATSQLDDSNIETHGPELLFDGNLATAYAEGADGSGEGEEIVIDLDGEYYIREIRCYPGNQLSEYFAEQYGYPTKLTFYFSDGSSRSSGLIDAPQPGDSFILLFIGDNPVKTDSIRVVIENASAGDKTSDVADCTCISEIEIYGYRAEAAEESVEDDDEIWQLLYADYITQNFLGSTDRLYEEFYLAYVNKDNIPELITVGNSSPGECSCMYIEDGEVKEIPLSGSVCFWLRNGKFSEEYEEYVVDYEDGQKHKVDRVYTLTEGGELVTEFEGSCDLITDDGEVIGYENYLANGQSVNAEEYEAMLLEASASDGPYYGTMSVSRDLLQTWWELAEVNTADGIIYSNRPSGDGSELDIGQMDLAPTAIEAAARLNSGDIPDIIGR